MQTSVMSSTVNSLCGCGKPSEKEGMKSCKDCRLANHAAWIRRKARQFKNGLCVRCNEPRMFGKRLCKKHSVMSQADIERVHKKSLDRTCKLCTQKVAGLGQRLCLEHKADAHQRKLTQDSQYRRDWRERLNAAGICIGHCGKPVHPNRVRCQDCAALNSQQVKMSRQKRIERGECSWFGCKASPLSPRLMCKEHLEKSAEISRRSQQKRKQAQ